MAQKYGSGPRWRGRSDGCTPTAGARASTAGGTGFVQNQLTSSSGRAARSSSTAALRVRSGISRARPRASRVVTRRMPRPAHEPRVDELVPVAREQHRRQRQPEERDAHLRRSDRRDHHARRRLLARLAEERRPHRVLDELPELRAIGHAPEEPDGDAEAALVAPAAAVRVAPSRPRRTPARATPPGRRSASACGASPRCTCRRRRRRRRTCRCPRAARGSRPPARSCRARTRSRSRRRPSRSCGARPAPRARAR